MSERDTGRWISEGDQVAVLDGIHPDDTVITGNLQKIGPGVPVQPLPGRQATTTP